jgi:hypothetical protein
MRAQNLKALTELLEEAAAASSGGYRLISRNIAGDSGRPLLGDPVRLAEWLVEAGAVLVPDAVSEQEALDLLHKEPAVVFARATEQSEGHWFREGLRRIASDSSGRPDDAGEAVLCLKGTHRWGVGAPATAPGGPGHTPASASPGRSAK